MGDLMWHLALDILRLAVNPHCRLIDKSKSEQFYDGKHPSTSRRLTSEPRYNIGSKNEIHIIENSHQKG